MLDGGNAAYLEQLYENYLQHPETMPDTWKTWFESLPQVQGSVAEIPHSVIRDQFRNLARHRHEQAPRAHATEPSQPQRQISAQRLIDAYRIRGHLLARFNPLPVIEPITVPDLQLQHHGLTDTDLDNICCPGSVAGMGQASLRDIIATLQQTYCGDIGTEYMHIPGSEEVSWIQQRLESSQATPDYPDSVKLELLNKLTAAEGLERFLHTKYVGQKRFSLEGGESLIPMLHGAIHHSTGHGTKEIVIGMAHRGRLNVLINIMGKTAADLFMEFEGKRVHDHNGTGDVKYHMGFSSHLKTKHGGVHVSLNFNPSHLEIVSPVVEGSVRARQDRREDTEGRQVIPVLIHGDAAFAGQGVVMETLNMSQSRGFSTKGTIHIIINNQIGFTTSNLRDARSSLYCTDVAKMVNAPIFHVNGDNPEAVLYVTQLALDYRMTFHKDVVIDMVCYRRHGHSEADEPLITQPMMYGHIRNKETTRTLYANRLIEAGIVDSQQAEAMLEEYRAALETGDSVVAELFPAKKHHNPYSQRWLKHLNRKLNNRTDTSIPLEDIRSHTASLEKLPEAFEVHPALAKIIQNRHKMAAGSLPIDWGFAETMAYASILKDGYSVRLSGQDCGRGTFFHRHAVMINQKDGNPHIPLRNLEHSRASFLVINSLLSEEAVLAFEYGYSTTVPDTLVIWEAQFGDFANNAQVVIDQFISAGEQKWNRLSGLVMLLPHGYEGQGPEHSSARVERYLQLCAQHNMQVCIPTTPAQIFHLLRRQMLRSCRKPLVVFSPKSLLRHPLAVSSLEDLTQEKFKPVIPDADVQAPAKVTRVVLCSGKVFYDLLEKRNKESLEHIAIIRIEQLYPFPTQELKRELERYPTVKKFIWCQEEPRNQGAWFQIQHRIRALTRNIGYLKYAGRPMSAAPAVGYPGLHVSQLRQLIDEALGLVQESPE